MTTKPSKRKSWKGGWKSPPQGWPRTNPYEFVRFVVYYRSTPETFVPYLNNLLGELERLFGKHDVELSGSVLPKAWASDLPWRAHTHYTTLKLPISTMRQPAVWKDVTGCLNIKGGHVPSLEARRGGGIAAHTVWALTTMDSRTHYPKHHRYSLSIATRHLTERDHRKVQSLMMTFFSTMLAADVVEGWGEIKCRDSQSAGSTDRLYHTDAEWVEEMRSLAFDSEERVILELHDAVLLTAQTVERLGGLQEMKARAADAQSQLEGQHNETHFCWEDYLQPVGDAVLWFCRPLFLSESLYFGMGRMALWLVNELVRAGVYAPARSDWLDKFNARAESYRVEREARMRQQKSEPETPAAPLNLDQAPSCLGFDAPRAADVPGFELADLQFAYELKPRDLSKGVTIYGRRTDTPNMLGSPVLVGSTNPERAALFFDDRIHGWDGACAEPTPAKARPIGRLAQLICPTCQGRLFKAWPVFTYPDDLAESIPEGLADRPENLFDWFNLVAECVGCRWNATVVDWECA